MYKWHVHSAIGRGRPVASDFSRLADGIAASLKHFSVSASKTAEGSDNPSGSRAERSANAAREVSSLAPRRGVDARSLAAKPPTQGFTIRRVDVRGGPVASRGGPVDSVGSGRGGYVSRGFPSERRGGFVPRGRGGFGGRGGMRGRGGRGGRGRGRGRGRGGRRGGRRQTDADETKNFVDPPLEPEEQAWVDGFEAGFEIPYNPTTSLEQLRSHAASVMPPSNPMGVVETVAHKFQVATSFAPAAAMDMHPASHLKKINVGGGSSFDSPEEKAAVQAYYDQIRQAQADKQADSGRRERKKVAPRLISTMDQLPENIRSEISKVWVAGHYIGPKHADIGDILGTVDQYTKLNETYLPHSAQKFEAKLKSLLPAAYRKQAPGTVPEPKREEKSSGGHVP